MAALAGALAAVCWALPALAITPNANEIALANLITGTSAQQRVTMTYHPILNMAARFHARDMATRPFWGHTDPDGYGSNYRVKTGELDLPGFYGQGLADNNVESIAAGNSTAQATFDQWMGSPPHKQHVLAELSFYQDQTYYGVGYYYKAGSPYSHYWVFISTPPDPDAALSVYIEWLFDHLTTAKMNDPTHDPDGDKIENLLEYALDFDPAVVTTNACFTFDYNPSTYAGEMTVPVRTDLDTQVVITVRTTTNLMAQAWTTSGVGRAGNTFSAGSLTDYTRFFRVYVTRNRP